MPSRDSCGVPEESAVQREVTFAQLCATVGVPSPRVLRTTEGAILLAAGSADTVWREMGNLLVHWWRRPDVLSQLTRTYRQAGGSAYPAGAGVFASGMAQWLNFLGAQAAKTLPWRTRQCERASSASTADSRRAPDWCTIRHTGALRAQCTSVRDRAPVRRVAVTTPVVQRCPGRTSV